MDEALDTDSPLTCLILNRRATSKDFNAKSATVRKGKP